MNLFFFLKPIFDMLYQFAFLDIGLLAILIYSGLGHKLRNLLPVDVIIMLWAIIFTLSMIRDFDGFYNWVKIISAFFIYFLGRLYSNGFSGYIRQMRKGFAVVVLFCLFSYIAGTGYTQWGGVNTFRGFYYFKTDLAAAMAQCMIVYGIADKLKKKNIFVLLICSFFIILANARIYYLIGVLELFYVYLYHKEIKKQKLLLKVNSKMILIVLSFVVLLVVLMIYLSQMFGEELLLIAISDSDSLYDNANTQGRNVMWEEIYENFTKSGFFSRLFGVDLISDTSMGFDSHNAYVKILYSSGYCGLALFAIISLRLAKVLNRMKNMGQRNLFYLTIGFLTIFYIAGFSASTIVFTQISWFAFFFAGACVSNVSQSKRLQLLNK